MRQSKHINIQILGTPDDRSIWKSLAAKHKMYLGEWIRKAIDAEIAAQTVQLNGHNTNSNGQTSAQIEAVAS